MPANITGNVFNDINHSGIYELGESGIQGVYVVLVDTIGNCNNVLTDSIGNYTFSNIPVQGSYTIYETVTTPNLCAPTLFTQPLGYTESTTQRQINLEVTSNNVNLNETLSGNNFGHDSESNFGCNPFAYTVLNYPSNLYRIDLVSGVSNNLGVLTPASDLRAIGYNSVDGNIWGYNFDTKRIARLTSGNYITDLSTTPNLPVLNYNCGDVDSNGYLYLYEKNDSYYYIVDVNSNRGSYGRLVDPGNSYLEFTTTPFGIALSQSLNINDWAFNPSDGYLYSIISETVPDGGTVAKISAIDGTVTLLTTTTIVNSNYGATFFDNYNNLYQTQIDTSELYQYAISGSNATRSYFSTIDTTSITNGAKCPQGPINFAYLDIMKYAPPSVGIGDHFEYVITLNNVGNTTAYNGTFVDTIPSSFNFVSHSLMVNWVTATGTPNYLQLATIPIGTTTITFEVDVLTLPNPNPQVNRALTAYNFEDSNGPQSYTEVNYSNASNTYINYILMPLLLDVNKHFTVLGDVLTYTMNYQNTGNITANNVILSNTLPSTIEYVPGSETGGTVISDNQISIGTVGIGVAGTITLQATVVTLPTNNIVKLDDTFLLYNFIANSTTGLTVNGSSKSNPISTYISYADLTTVNDIASKSYASVGDSITYTVFFWNSGNAIARGVRFLDTLPNGTMFTNNSMYINGVNQVGASPTFPGISLPNISPKSRVTITFQVSVGTIPNPNIINNTAGISYTFDYATLPYNTINLNAQTEVNTAYVYPIKSADKISATIGDEITYTITLINNGNTTANNIVIVDTLPTGVILVPNSYKQDNITIPVTSNYISLPNSILEGSISTVTFRASIVTIPTTNPLTNNASLVYQFTVNPTIVNGYSSGNNSNSISTYVTYADITTVNKVVDKSYVEVSENLNYTIFFRNSGNTTATNIMFIDTIPGSTVFVDNSLYINGNQQLGLSPIFPGVTIPSLSPNNTVTINFNVTVVSIPVNYEISNEAKIVYSYDTATLPIETISNSVSSTVSMAVLTNLNKVKDKEYAAVNENIIYIISFSNSGNITAKNIMFIDTIPNNTSYIDNTLYINGILQVGKSPSATGITIPDLEAGKTTTVSFQVMVESIPNNNKVSNSAVLSYTHGINTIPHEIISNITSTTISFADLMASKYSNIDYSDINNTISYSIVITNAGNTTASNIVFIDTVPTYCSYISNTIMQDGVTVNNVTNIISCTLPSSLSSGKTTTVTFMVFVTSVPLSNIISNTATIKYNYTTNPSLIDDRINSIYSNSVVTTVNNANLEGPTMLASKGYATLGEIIDYVIVIENKGNVAATNIIYKNTIPNGTVYVANTLKVNEITQPNGDLTLGVTLPSINAFSTTTVTYSLQL